MKTIALGLALIIGLSPVAALAQNRGGGGGGGRPSGGGARPSGGGARPSGGGGASRPAPSRPASAPQRPASAPQRPSGGGQRPGGGSGFNIPPDGPKPANRPSGNGGQTANRPNGGGGNGNVNRPNGGGNGNGNVNRPNGGGNGNGNHVGNNNININHNGGNYHNGGWNGNGYYGRPPGGHTTVVVRPGYYPGPAYGWNRGVIWAPVPTYWGGGFWGALAISATSAAIYGSIVSSSTHTTYTSYQVQPDSPGATLLKNYQLTQVQCGPPGLVQIYGPADSVICANPNSLVAAGDYDMDASQLTLISQ